MEKEIRTLLFKLVNCRGIGNLGRLKVLSFILENDCCDIKKEDIIRIGEIRTYESAFSASWDELSKNPDRLQTFQDEHQFLTILDEQYPRLLKEIYNCPALLFYKGNPELLTQKSIAIVGAREASSYGMKIVREFIPVISQDDWVIVSGLAKGIDGQAHEEAIKSKGKTIGVVGTGLDRCYPKENTYLHRLMSKEQLIISEYPNGTSPRKHHFPMRNRIIAGLSQATCLIEARRNSGSLITAQSALEYGREVFIVPGNIFLPHSEGCHTLMYEGAKPVISARNIIDELNFFH